MEKKTIQLVQDSWKKVALIAPQAAELFYKNLFEADPSLKNLFKNDMIVQGKKLTQMLGAAVNGLNNLEKLIPVVEDLGKRHVDYGVKESQYKTVGAALLKTLSQGLGKDFTPEVEKAWTEVYGVLSKVMIDASKRK